MSSNILADDSAMIQSSCNMIMTEALLTVSQQNPALWLAGPLQWIAALSHFVIVGA
jgi:hypothetical protein